jgi:hypothetical protein
MKKFSKKGILLFAAAMALCAFAPSMASASSWGVVGSAHTLDSQDLGFLSDSLGTSSMCTRTQFTSNVASTASIEITAASFSGCTLGGGAAGTCTATSTGTSFPWTATAVSTSNVQIHGVNINVFLEAPPSGTCNVAGVTIRITGTLSGAKWNGNGAGQHSINILGGTGLVAHSILSDSTAITPTGTISDTQQTLTVTN